MPIWRYTHVVAFVDVPDGTDDMQAMEYAYSDKQRDG